MLLPAPLSNSISSSLSDISFEDQTMIINANLNSNMLLNYLMGMYTVVYAGTLYLCLTRRGKNFSGRIVISAITALYLLCCTFVGLQWSDLQRTVVDNGATRTTIFTSLIQDSALLWKDEISLASLGLMNIISDVLLLWRCFQLWDRSWRAISLPLFLTVSETALFIPSVFFDAKNAPRNCTCNALTTTLLAVSAGSTIVTTFLIGYRIYKAASRLTGSKMKNRLERILVVLLESAAAYTAILLCMAAFTALPLPTWENLPNRVVVAFYYIQTLLPITAGMAPTILVARIITARSDETDSVVSFTHISGLQFDSQPIRGRSGASYRP